MDKLNIEYGKFLIAFESICQDLRSTINSMCTTKGVMSKEFTYIEILMHGLTAYPLIEKYRAIFMTKYAEGDSCLEHINTLYKLFLKVVEIRNSLAHGTTSLGDPHANINNFTLKYPKLNKQGYYSNMAVVEIKSLTELNHQIEKLGVCFRLVKLILSLRKAEREDQDIITRLKEELIIIDIELKIVTRSIQS